MFLMQVCTFFTYGILSFLYDVIDLYIYVKYNRYKNNTFKGFHDKSCEVYCKYIFMIIKVLTATASNSSRYVYVK